MSDLDEYAILRAWDWAISSYYQHHNLGTNTAKHAESQDSLHHAGKLEGALPAAAAAAAPAPVALEFTGAGTSQPSSALSPAAELTHSAQPPAQTDAASLQELCVAETQCRAASSSSNSSASSHDHVAPVLYVDGGLAADAAATATLPAASATLAAANATLPATDAILPATNAVLPASKCSTAQDDGVRNGSFSNGSCAHHASAPASAVDTQQATDPVHGAGSQRQGDGSMTGVQAAAVAHKSKRPRKQKPRTSDLTELPTAQQGMHTEAGVHTSKGSAGHTWYDWYLHYYGPWHAPPYAQPQASHTTPSAPPYNAYQHGDQAYQQHAAAWSSSCRWPQQAPPPPPPPPPFPSLLLHTYASAYAPLCPTCSRCGACMAHGCPRQLIAPGLQYSLGPAGHHAAWPYAPWY